MAPLSLYSGSLPVKVVLSLLLYFISIGASISLLGKFLIDTLLPTFVL